jgi:16S rRNA processing protein RimM
VYAGREPASVVESKRSGGRLVVSLDREVPRGSLLELPASELPPAPEGEFYVFELVGLTAVEEGGRVLGRVLDVAPGVANDVLELEGGVALPMVEECVLAVDVEEGRVVIAPGFVPES